MNENDMNTPENNDNNDNNSAETWETEMTSAFDRRVRDLHEAPLTLDNVKGKAVNIQRKRRVAVAGGILAAAAVVTPVAILATNGLNDPKADDGLVATNTPTVTDDSNPTPEPVDAAPSYLEGTTWHRADGTTVELPSTEYTAAVQLGVYVVAYRQDDQANGLIDVLDNGGVTGTYESTGPFVVNDAGDLASFMRTDGTVVTIGLTGDTQELQGGFDAVRSRVTALDGSGADAIAYVTTSGDPNVVTAVSLGGTSEVPGALTVKDATPDGGIVAQTKSTDFGSCSALRDVSGKAVLKTCDYLLEELSPSGDHLLASDAYGDGIGRGYFVILDLEGNEIARFEPSGGGFVGQTEWIDDDTIAATVYDYQAGEWSIATLSPDELVDGIAGPVKGEDLDPVFFLTD